MPVRCARNGDVSLAYDVLGDGERDILVTLGWVPASPASARPHWDPYARGTLVGLTRGAGRAHLVRALERARSN